MKKEFYDRLESSLRTYGNEWIRREALEETRKACGQIEKRVRPAMSRKAFLLSQLRFAGGKIWALEAGVLLMLLLMVNGILRSPALGLEHGEVCFLLGAAAVVSAMAGIPHLYRSNGTACMKWNARLVCRIRYCRRLDFSW